MLYNNDTDSDGMLQKEIMNDKKKIKSAKEFVDYWKGKGYEKGESQRFWIDLSQNIYGVEDVIRYITFEEKIMLDHTSFINSKQQQYNRSRRSMNKKILYYICPTFVQITLVSLITFILRKNGYVCGYNSMVGIILIIAAGVSSALWGCVFQIKYNGKNIKTIFKDFFNFKADCKSYILVIIFMILDFLDILISGSMQITMIYTLLFLFIKSIAFGGIEEIGWRYTFQPFIEKRLSYFSATIVTFVFWGVWHFLFFYIDGSILDIQTFPFLMGLLTNCFILSAIYNYKNNLWLCVLAHSLVNTFSQVAIGGNIYIGFVAKIIIISLSILLSRYSKSE